MSGLFRRLARQATGQPQATVHAMARLPFQAPPELLPTQDGAAPLMAPADGVQSSRGGVPVVSAPAAATQAALHHATPGAESVAPTSLQIPPLVHTPLPAADSAVAPKTASRPRASAPVADQGQPGLDPLAADIHGAERPVGASLPERLLDPVAAATFERTSHPAGTQDAAGVKPPSAVPDPLLPTQTTPAAARRSEPASATATARVAAEPTEVHVHIGRIEVTAVQAPAPAKRPARSGQAPMSLDAYLAKRQRSPS